MAIKAVFLDLGNTLIANECYVNIEKDVEFPFWCRRGYKGTLKELIEIKKKTKPEFMQSAFRNSKDKHMWTEVIAKTILGKNSDEKTIASCYELIKMYYTVKASLREGALELLKYLKSKKIKIILISNNWTDVAIAALDFLEIKEYFDSIIISEDVCAIKSELKPFAVALEKAGVSPTECIMVGDDKEDSYCKKLGIYFALLDAHNNGLDMDYDYKITELLEIKKLVEEIV